MNETEMSPEKVGALIVSPAAYATQKALMAGFRWLRHNNPLVLIEADGFDQKTERALEDAPLE